MSNTKYINATNVSRTVLAVGVVIMLIGYITVGAIIAMPAMYYLIPEA